MKRDHHDWVATVCALGSLAFGVDGLRNGFDYESTIFIGLAAIVLTTQLARRLFVQARRFPPGQQVWEMLADSRVDLSLGIAAAVTTTVNANSR
jgi:hypothetical protein